MTPDWPVADFDQVRRLRVVAATTPGSAIRETVLDASLASVWAVAADLETELPRWLFPDIRSVRVSAAGGDRLEALMTGHSGLRARFEVVLRPGWCLMRSRFLLGGMAAIAENGGTRFAVLGGFRGPLRLLTGVTRQISDRNGRQALARFAQRVDERG
jgi:hypothetical protein